jgi:alcohol dehydrogenase YqhD (iron-dependent ADH family)
MENFIAYNPTKIHFGKGVTGTLGEYLRDYGDRTMLIYGKGSAVKYGYYDRIRQQLQAAGLEIVEYSGIKPNPIIEDVDQAIKIGAEKQVPSIVALGGGSVIDSAKIISLGIPGKYSGWDIMKGKIKLDQSVPLITVLTLAATGTEMNGAAVIQNHATNEKIGYVNELSVPKHSFLDPEFTLTVPRDYTAYGIVDLIAHALEAYFSKTEVSLTDRFVISIIKDAMHYGPLLLNELDNYEYRANIMLDAMCALNGITSYGRDRGDWGVHAIGHQLSMLYDLAHGATLSIAYPAWLKLQTTRIGERIKGLGKSLFGITSATATIGRLTKFFVSLKCPVHLGDVGIDNGKKTEIVQIMNQNKVTGMNHPLTNEDHTTLVNLMM